MAQFGYRPTAGESRRLKYVVAFTRFAGGGIWLRQESQEHIKPGHPATRPPKITSNLFQVCTAQSRNPARFRDRF